MTGEVSSRGFRLDPQARALLERAAASRMPAFHTLQASEARRLYREICVALQPQREDVASALDTEFSGPAGPVPVRVYRPAGSTPSEPLPVAVYFHGGAMTFGDLDTHDGPCRTLTNYARCALVSVAYRLGPEHRFPAALEDAIAAVRWAAAEGERHGFDVRRIALAGDSAGGNLAAGAALALREELSIAMQVLIYPALDMRASMPSHLEFARGYLLERELVLWSVGNYLRDQADAADWRASPLLAKDHSRVAPAYVITAGFDPLLDEGAAYAEKLAGAGVEVTYECFEGMVHGFVTMGAVLAAANHALYRIGQSLRGAYSRGKAAAHVPDALAEENRPPSR